MKISIRCLTLTVVIARLVDGAARLAAHDPVGTRVTWSGDVARIFQAHCVSCHKAGSQSPMPLTTYDEVRPWVAAIRQQVLSRKMPIWHAVRGFGEFGNDPSLSSLEIAVIAAWANAGGPRGSASPDPAGPPASAKGDNRVRSTRLQHNSRSQASMWRFTLFRERSSELSHDSPAARP